MGLVDSPITRFHWFWFCRGQKRNILLKSCRNMVVIFIIRYPLVSSLLYHCILFILYLYFCIFSVHLVSILLYLSTLGPTISPLLAAEGSFFPLYLRFCMALAFVDHWWLFNPIYTHSVNENILNEVKVPLKLVDGNGICCKKTKWHWTSLICMNVWCSWISLHLLSVHWPIRRKTCTSRQFLEIYKQTISRPYA